MKTLKKSIIIDVDGTLYDKFSHDDKKIIEAIFKNNFFIKIVDKLLWSINSLDYISNSMGMLKFRLMLYSILSLKSYYKVSLAYKHRYQRLLTLHLYTKALTLKRLSEMYEVILVTNNVYALNELYHNYHVLYAPNVLNRREQILTLHEDSSISYIIGNNFTDDIFLAKRHKIACIYVGNSILKNKYKANYNVLSFDEVIKIIKEDGY